MRFLVKGTHRFLQTRNGVTAFAQVGIVATPDQRGAVLWATELEALREVHGAAVDMGIQLAVQAHRGMGGASHRFEVVELMETAVDSRPDAVRCAAALAAWRSLGHDESDASVVFEDGAWKVELMSAWSISLAQIGPISPSMEAKDYHPELDNIISVLNDICESLSEEGSVQFLVSGFGHADWPVDVYTDLCVVIEQVPVAIRSLRRGEPAILSFYEQGPERDILMNPTGAETVVECQSRTSWRPDPSVIRMKSAKLVEMLEVFLDTFVDRARQRRPALVQHPWFREWLDSSSTVGK